MRRIMFLALALVFSLVQSGFAALDQYVGDSGIYGYNESQKLPPNVLFIIDNSNKASDAASGGPYDAEFTGTGTDADPTVISDPYTNFGYDPLGIYSADQQGDFPTNKLEVSLDDLSCPDNAAGEAKIKSTLKSAGTYVGSGTTAFPNIRNGTCVTAPKGETYALGNFLNYTLEPVPDPVGGEVAETPDSQLEVVYKAIQGVVTGAHGANVRFGAMVFGENNKGGKVVHEISHLSDPDDPNDTTALNNFLASIPGGSSGAPLLTSQTARPQAEALLDAGYYFRGQPLPISGQSAMTSPITRTCDKNFVIFITNGLSNKDDDPLLGSLVGDVDGDNSESAAYGLGTHYFDDVAKKLYEEDAIDDASLDGVQNIVTHTVLAFQSEDPLVKQAADAAHGRGSFHNVFTAPELSKALVNILVNIVMEADTSFVAPVVPTSPENRTYSGERVYLGFFKPVSQKPWRGNLKKYAIDSNSEIVDKNGNAATLSDGTFTDSATSFWSTSADKGLVEEGGVGEKLLDRNFTSNPRKIYANLAAGNADLTHADNAFNTTNLSALELGVADDATRDVLVHYVYGYDSLNDDGDDTTGNPTNGEKRDWILGDILHSKPAVVNYSTYDFTTANESNCNVNKTVIYVGTNDGMLHAFRDCDGEELWAFVPDAVIPNLKELIERPAAHSYYVDSTPVPYIYDKDNDGNIGTAEANDGDSDDGSSDKVILYFGLRRGGDAYYALDVTDSTSPDFIYRIDSSTSGFSELGQSWSEPHLGKVEYFNGTTVSDKIVAFFGAGYDNENEDRRYGANSYFSGDVSTDLVSGSENLTSSGDASTSSVSPKGRGVYAIEVATLNSGVPTIATSPTLLWEFTHATSGDDSYNRRKMTYSFPSEITVLDTDYDGYTDRLYVGDTGGNMWRFSKHFGSSGDYRPDPSKQINNWSGKRIFTTGSVSESDNDIVDTSGRKIFYRPSVTYQGDYIALYFGTGDRAHPLNTAVTDRLYAVYDRGQRTNEEIDDANLVDVTEDLLQSDSTSASDVQSILTALHASTNYGWRIDLDRENDNSVHAGEKVLSAALVFNKVAYYTTYTPNTNVSVDPCSPGNLGVSRLYAVDYKTGEAVLNFDKDNDSTPTDSTNDRAVDDAENILRRNDRSLDLGVGIPSGIVVVMPPDGDAKILIGSGGGLLTADPLTGGSIFPIYWQQF